MGKLSVLMATLLIFSITLLHQTLYRTAHVVLMKVESVVMVVTTCNTATNRLASRSIEPTMITNTCATTVRRLNSNKPAPTQVFVWRAIVMMVVMWRA